MNTLFKLKNIKYYKLIHIQIKIGVLEDVHGTGVLKNTITTTEMSRGFLLSCFIYEATTKLRTE